MTGNTKKAVAMNNWCNRVRSSQCEYNRKRCKYMHVDEYVRMTPEARQECTGAMNIMLKHANYLKKDMLRGLAMVSSMSCFESADVMYMWLANEFQRLGWYWPEHARDARGAETFVRDAIVVIVNTLHFDLQGAPEVMLETCAFLEDTLEKPSQMFEGYVAREDAASPCSMSSMSAASPILFAAAGSDDATDDDSLADMPELCCEPMDDDMDDDERSMTPLLDIPSVLSRCFSNVYTDDTGMFTAADDVSAGAPLSPTMAPSRLSSVYSAASDVLSDCPAVVVESASPRSVSPTGLVPQLSVLSSPTTSGLRVPSILKKTSSMRRRVPHRVSFDLVAMDTAQVDSCDASEEDTPDAFRRVRAEFALPPPSASSALSLYADMCLA